MRHHSPATKKAPIPWFLAQLAPGGGFSWVGQPAQTLHALIPPILERSPDRVMPVMDYSERPQQIGNGSFVGSEGVAAQGRLETPAARR